MSYLDKSLERRIAELKKVYNPKNAFGNADILNLVNDIAVDRDYMSRNKPCPQCEGTGYVECGECSQDKSCPDCHGEGYIPR